MYVPILGERMDSFLTDKVALFETPSHGIGAISIEPIAEKELVAVFGGVIISYQELMSLSEEQRSMVLQVDIDRFSFSDTVMPPDHINHSCAPNLGFSDSFTLLAMRDIGVGEAVTFDYAMADSIAFDEFDCLCGSLFCRGRVTGNDWMRPDLQERYASWFSPYLKKRRSVVSQKSTTNIEKTVDF